MQRCYYCSAGENKVIIIMEIDIFPIPSAKGVHRYIGTSFLGLIIITYIIGAYKIAQQLIGEDKELLCFLVTIPIFIGGLYED